MLFFWLFITIILNFFLSCGYSTRIIAQSQFKKVGIAMVENETLKPGLAELLTEKLNDYFIKQSQITLVDIENAELLISCIIKNYEKTPQVYDAQQNITLWQIKIDCNIKTEDKIRHSNVYEGVISEFVNYRPEETEEENLPKLMERLSSEIYRQIFTQW